MLINRILQHMRAHHLQRSRVVRALLRREHFLSPPIIRSWIKRYRRQSPVNLHMQKDLSVWARRPTLPAYIQCAQVRGMRFVSQQRRPRTSSGLRAAGATASALWIRDVLWTSSLAVAALIMHSSLEPPPEGENPVIQQLFKVSLCWPWWTFRLALPVPVGLYIIQINLPAYYCCSHLKKIKRTVYIYSVLSMLHTPQNQV